MLLVAYDGNASISERLHAFVEGWGDEAIIVPANQRTIIDAADVVVCAGLVSDRHTAILSEYRDTGIPAFGLGFGHIRCGTPAARNGYNGDHVQVSLWRNNNPPQFDCPPDRFDRLGLTINGFSGDPNGYVLVCGQMPQDRSHGLTRSQYRRWLRDQPGVIRQHPRVKSPVRKIEDDLAGARLVRTYTSNAGIDALIYGVPAVAVDPERAVWGELSDEQLPSVAERRRVLSRLAHGQWTLDELRNGECAGFIKSTWLPRLGYDTNH